MHLCRWFLPLQAFRLRLRRFVESPDGGAYPRMPLPAVPIPYLHGVKSIWLVRRSHSGRSVRIMKRGTESHFAGAASCKTGRSAMERADIAFQDVLSAEQEKPV